MAGEISDVTFPNSASLDRDSKQTALNSHHGNAYCGVMSIPEGIVYLAPYDTHGGATPHPVPQTGAAKVAGQSIEPIWHQKNGIPGHEQLATMLVEKAGVVSPQGFVGFSVWFSSDKDGFGGTSRSQNNQHFRRWILGDQDQAFAAYHGQTGRLDGLQVEGPPRFHDVTGPADGELPAAWVEQLRALLARELGNKWTACISAGPARRQETLTGGHAGGPSLSGFAAFRNRKYRK